MRERLAPSSCTQGLTDTSANLVILQNKTPCADRYVLLNRLQCREQQRRERKEWVNSRVHHQLAFSCLIKWLGVYFDQISVGEQYIDNLRWFCWVLFCFVFYSEFIRQLYWRKALVSLLTLANISATYYVDVVDIMSEHHHKHFSFTATIRNFDPLLRKWNLMMHVNTSHDRNFSKTGS